jgi:hypothetical protein
MPSDVDRFAHRLNVTLDPDHAARLARLARLAGVPGPTLARSLLSSAIEDADPDARTIVPILDGIPGAYDRVVESWEHADAGDTIDLDDL